MADKPVVYLGDVPGPDGILPGTDEILPDAPSVLEVNGVGEVSVDDVGLGDPTSWQTMTQDPFAFRVDGDGETTSGEDPQARLHAPSYTPSNSSGGGGGSTASNSYIGPASDSFDNEQLANAETISEVGEKVGASERDIQIAIMVGLVESNLHNVEYGDRDSVGVFQQRDAWGSTEDRMDVAKSAEMFFKGGQAGQQGLLDIKDRDSRTLGDLAQDVQVSAFPERYAEREQEASEILGSLKGSQTRGSYKGQNPYDLTEYGGKTVDYLTSAALDAASKEFGGGFRVMQGSHNHGGVAASGGTHDGGGVIDLAPENGDWEGAMTALRKIGFAAWVRNVPGYGSAGDGAHIHAVLIGNEKLSPQAQVQVQSYLNNDDGLKGSRPDDGPREYVNNRFVWGDALKENESWRDDVTKNAETFLGSEFKWGGEDFTGADDAGLIRRTYKHLGIKLPKTTFELSYAADPIPVKDLKPGDLIAWGQSPETGGDKVGVYLGDGQYISGRPGGVFELNDIGDVTNAWGVPLGSLMKPAGSAPVAAPAPVSNAPAKPQGMAPNGGGEKYAPHVPGSINKPAKPKPDPKPDRATGTGFGPSLDF